MKADLMQELRRKARASPKRVVFPESGDEKIVRAARRVLDMGIAHPILVGNRSALYSLAEGIGIDISEIETIDNSEESRLDAFVQEYASINPDFPARTARRILTKPLYFAAMMVRTDYADAMVAGLDHTTGEVIMASQMIIGMQEGIEVPSSMFLMSIPGYDGPEGNLIVFADGSVCPDPSADQLADIAITTAETVHSLLDWEPRVAMLSFSTKGSAPHPKVDHVLNALELVKKRKPDLCIDGEFQVDAAIVPEVAAKKVPDGSLVAGRANILIFPDLNAGNIAYKLVQRLARADAYGPLIQGFAKTVSDLSRGSTVDDIVGATIMVVVRAQAL